MHTLVSPMPPLSYYCITRTIFLCFTFLICKTIWLTFQPLCFTCVLNPYFCLTLYCIKGSQLYRIQITLLPPNPLLVWSLSNFSRLQNGVSPDCPKHCKTVYRLIAYHGKKAYHRTTTHRKGPSKGTLDSLSSLQASTFLRNTRLSDTFKY